MKKKRSLLNFIFADSGNNYTEASAGYCLVAQINNVTRIHVGCDDPGSASRNPRRSIPAMNVTLFVSIDQVYLSSVRHVPECHVVEDDATVVFIIFSKLIHVCDEESIRQQSLRNTRLPRIRLPTQDQGQTPVPLDCPVERIQLVLDFHLLAAQFP